MRMLPRDSRAGGAAPLLVLATLLSVPMSTRAELPPLISRDVLFGNPEKVNPQLSPDGKRLAWIAPDEKNVLQVWVQTVGADDGKVITADTKRGIRQYFWAYDNRTLVYLQDADGDENFHLFGVDLESGNVRDLTPFQGVKAEVVALEPNFPDTLLVGLNLRDRTLFDVHRLDLRTGALTLDTANPGDVTGWGVDATLKVRAAQAATPEGGVVIRLRDDPASDWRAWIEAGPEDSLTLQFLDFNADGTAAYLISALGRDTAAVVRKNLATGVEEVLASAEGSDAGGVFYNARTRTVQAVAFAPGRTVWKVVDPAVQADFDAIAKLHDGDFNIASRDDADTTWLLAFTSDRGPIRYYTYDRRTKQGTFLFVHQPKLEGLQLAAMQPVQIKARDGLTLNAYLTLPVGIEPKNLPLVLLVHGGPWARDGWGYSSLPQWFANRGYATLQVNYRGSTGYGKAFLNAANKQWGKAMHDDLIDACEWAVLQGYADRGKIAIFGGSYGGYAALAGVTLTPEFFTCAVDLVGPSNLKTLIQSIPPYWKPMRSIFDTRLGNVDDPADEALIREASPLFKADRIVRPLLIGQGANDPRVKQAESEQIVSAIEANGGKVTYVLYPDEGHGFARPENRIDFNARAEKFLADHLGGRFELISGDQERHPGSTAVVREVGK